MTAGLSRSPSWLRRVLRAVRIWFEWGDMASERLSPAHGWLLPRLPAVRAVREPRAVPVVISDPTIPGTRTGA